MDFELSPEDKEFKRRVGEFFDQTLPREYVREFESKDEYPLEFWKKMAQAGYCGLMVPEEYGGSSGSAMQLTLFMEELARRAYSMATWYMVATVFGAQVMKELGTEEMKREYLPKIARGEIRFCFAITEPSAGTDVFALTTFAAEKGDEFIINGDKMFITAADVADYFLLVARTKRLHEITRRSDGLSLFLVPSNTPGISMTKLEKLTAQGCHACQVFYDDVRVPKQYLLGEKDKGWHCVKFILNVERVSMAGFYLGLQQATFDYALNYAKERVQFGRPIGQFMAIQHDLAKMYIDLETGRMWTYKLAWMSDQGKELHLEAMMTKFILAENYFHFARKGMEIMAGHGLIKDHDMEKYYRNLIPGPPTQQMCLSYIGQYRLGLPRCY
jgi:acyl-CoA dehydrogenase